MRELIKLLNRLVKIYQIPNIDNESLVYLSEWIMETYKHHDFELIEESLKNPSRNDFNTWRLTPDTISLWIEHTQNKRANKAIAEESKTRQEQEVKKHQYSHETEKMIQDFKNSLFDGIKSAPELSEKEIKENGQERPKAIKRHFTDLEYLIMKELRRKWANEVHDKYTGEPLDNWLSFDEWIKI